MMSKYRILDVPANGTRGQDCGTFGLAELPARVRAAVLADPARGGWRLPARAGGDSGPELDDLAVVVTRQDD
jgi:hypothetical protein